MVIGYEVNDMDNKNHYLVFGMDEVIGTYQVLENGEYGCKTSSTPTLPNPLLLLQLEQLGTRFGAKMLNSAKCFWGR